MHENFRRRLKQVPDTETKIKIAADGKGVDLTGAKWILCPYDEFAWKKPSAWQKEECRRDRDGALVRKLDSGEVPRSHPTAQAMALAIFLAMVGLAMAAYLVFLRV